MRARVGEIALAVSGMATGGEKVRINGVSTDTRTIRRGELFVALIGEKFDGHSFLEEAIAKGAGAAMVEAMNPNVGLTRRKFPSFPLIITDSTQKALGDLARHHRKSMDILAIGITGSTGKTSTKDYLYSCLKQEKRVMAPRESYNNEIGVPLTVLSARKDHEALIVELGARHPGDIKALAEIVSPRIGIITNIGVAHLEIFKSRRRIAAAKAELAESLPPGGYLILNADDKWTGWISSRTSATTVTFGFDDAADYRIVMADSPDGESPAFTLRGRGIEIDIRVHLPARHLLQNASAAAVCAHLCGIDPQRISSGISQAKLSKWRCETVKAAGGYTVINDAYNANPFSMSAAFDSLRIISGQRRKIVVLGDMEELGKDSASFHEAVGHEAVTSGADIMIAAGRNASHYVAGALKAGMPKGSVFGVKDRKRALEVLRAIVEKGDVILVKASRAAGFEKIADAVMNGSFLISDLEAPDV